MTGFATTALERKLVDLNNSQQSIQTLSLWLIHHRKHHKSIVQTWFAELKKAKPSRRLTFMYLANDVIQNSRKKGPEFSKEFGAVLKASFEVVAKDSDDKTLASLERILTIWESRNIYETNQINSFRTSLTLRKNQNQKDRQEANNNASNNNSDKVENDLKSKVKEIEKNKDKDKDRDKHKKEQKSSKESKSSDKKESKKRSHDSNKESSSPKKRVIDNSKLITQTQNNNNDKIKSKSPKTIDRLDKPTIIPLVNSGIPVDSETLIKALQGLENSASADARVRQKIASLPTEVFDATLLDKIRDKGAADRLTKLVDEARTMLSDYNNRLSQELEERKHISAILSSFTQNQRLALTQTEQKLNEYKEKLRKVVHVRNELRSHLQNLPDLSRLPSVAGLAPLPSACDLFNVARIGNSTESVSSSVSPNESNASPVDTGTPGSNTSL